MGLHRSVSLWRGRLSVEESNNVFIYLFIVTIYFRWNLLVCFPSWPWLSGLKWSSCLSLLSNQSHITTPTLLGSVLVLFFIMNPLSSIYVRGPSVLLPQETSYFLCISRTVPVETDGRTPRAGEFSCKC